MGYESLYFWREHYSEMNMRVQNKSLQFNWKVSEDNGRFCNKEFILVLGNSILTGAFNGDYCAPLGFNWERADPIIDNPDLEDYNLDAQLNAFMEYINKMVLES